MKRTVIIISLLLVVLVAGCGTFVSPPDAEKANQTFDEGRQEIVSDLTDAQVKLAKDQAIAATQPTNSAAAKQVEADQAVVNAHSTALTNYDKMAPVIKKTFAAATQPSGENIQAGGSALGEFIAQFNPGIGGGIVLGSALIGAIVKAFQNGKKADTAQEEADANAAKAEEAKKIADLNAEAVRQLGDGVAAAIRSLRLTDDEKNTLIATINAAALAGHDGSNKFLDAVTTALGKAPLPE